MTRRIVAAMAALGTAALLLAGCATGTAVNPGSPDPEDVDQGGTVEIEVDAAWLDGGRAIAIITQGSSSCVPTASDVTLEADGTLAVTLVEPAADTPCTRDMAPRATLVALPEGVDPTKELEIAVTGEGYYGDTDLDGATNIDTKLGEGLPSAGWTDKDGVFVILTYGSGSCVPVVENTEVTAENAVAVTFVTPAADQVCTMDFVGRVVLADAPGVEANGNTQLTLSGGGDFGEPVTIPIYG